MVKKGDTLIEVTLAVGIFSMIAIAVVAVMSGGTSGAQTALETTLTRNEIDAQAEALRFIHTSYIAGKDTANNNYQALWQKITDNAIVFSGSDNSVEKESILQFSPNTCGELYGNNRTTSISKAFIINYRNLGNLPKENVNVNNFIATSGEKNIFEETTTYPRLAYNDDSGALDTSANQTADPSAYGIFIVAVKDNNTTNMVSENERSSAFYDFYIRTCWYGTNAEEPSTISTVIRLYDPNVVK